MSQKCKMAGRIFREFIAGYSINQICKRLGEDGIKTKLGKERWCHSTIESILMNEKYTGNALLGKTFKPDVLSKNRQKNDGKKAPSYYVEGTHPAIIEQGMFDLAKKEMQRRRESNENRLGGGKYSSRYPFSGMLVCGICGSSCAGTSGRWAAESGRHHGGAVTGSSTDAQNATATTSMKKSSKRHTSPR